MVRGVKTDVVARPPQDDARARVCDDLRAGEGDVAERLVLIAEGRPLCPAMARAPVEPGEEVAPRRARSGDGARLRPRARRDDAGTEPEEAVARRHDAGEPSAAPRLDEDEDPDPDSRELTGRLLLPAILAWGLAYRIQAVVGG